MKRTVTAILIAATMLAGCSPAEQASSDIAQMQQQSVSDKRQSFDEIKADVWAHVVEPTAYNMNKNATERNEARHEAYLLKHEQLMQRLEYEAEALAQAEAAAQVWFDYEYPEIAYYGTVEAQGTPIPSNNTDLRTAGVIYGEDGTRYTWYSQNVLPGGGLTELNSNGRTVDGNGYVVDADGYIAVASGEHEKGTVLETPFGEAKVYDYCETPGTVDVYTAW